MAEMQQVVFQNTEKKIERTHNLTGKVISVEGYTAKVKNQTTGMVSDTQGFALEISGVPYKMRVLKGSVSGANSVATLLGCEVELTGVMADYQGKTYFNPKDCKVTKQSVSAILAASGIAYSGSLV